MPSTQPKPESTAEMHLHAYEQAARCHRETNLAMSAVVLAMGLQYHEQAKKLSDRLSNLVQPLKAEWDSEQSPC